MHTTIKKTTHKKEKKSKAKFEALDNTRKGELLWIAVKDLVIPDSGDQGYQREAVAGHAASIASHFDWRLFGALDVVKRIDLSGCLEVADGGNRLRAAIMRGDVGEAPCIVFTANSTEEAAAIFTGININRKALSYAATDNAMLLANNLDHQKAKELKEQLNQTYVIFTSTTKCLLKFCKNPNEEAAIRRLIPVIKDLHAYTPKRISTDFLKAMVELESFMFSRFSPDGAAGTGFSLSDPKRIKKMRSLGLPLLMDFSCVQSGRHPRAFARVLADRLNIRPDPFDPRGD